MTSRLIFHASPVHHKRHVNAYKQTHAPGRAASTTVATKPQNSKNATTNKAKCVDKNGKTLLQYSHDVATKEEECHGHDDGRSQKDVC